jgi:hypothetical protein
MIKRSQTDNKVTQDVVLTMKNIFTNLVPLLDVLDNGGKIVLNVEVLKQK